MRRASLKIWPVLFAVAYLVIAVQLFSIQVLERHRYQPMAEKQATRKITLPPERGVIYDRNFNVLAFDLKQYSFGAVPSELSNKRRLAQIFAKLTSNSVDYYLDLLRGDRYVWLARRVDQRTAEQIPYQEFKALSRVEKTGRYYPYHRVGAHLIGFTNVDNVGLEGVEAQYDKILQGKPGYKVIHVDVHKKWVPALGDPEREPEEGNSLVLTLDIDYQLIAQEELRKGVERYGARGGMLVMLDPSDGSVLAMASVPEFNPNHFMNYSPGERRNRVLVDPYEPGSTFKLVTAAAALQEGVLKPGDRIFCENGRMRVPGGYITDHEPFGTLTFADVFAHSSNIGFAKIAQMVGKRRIFEYARAFGFGEKTGIDLPGESRGRLKNPAEWSASDALRIPIGYGVLVTALQMANAYAAVANGGYLIRPHVVKAILQHDLNQPISETRPDTIRRVLLPETVRMLKHFMRETVEKGTAKKAAVKGISVAGKTGTSKKFDPVQGRYSNTKYMATFVGFAPVEKPRFVCLVTLDEPKYPYYYGGSSAAPIFRNILRRIIDSVSAPPSEKPVAVFPDGKKVSVPDVTELSPAKAQAILQDFKFEVRTRGSGSFVIRQQPPPGTLLAPGEIVQIVLGSHLAKETEPREVPDVRGKSLRDAIFILTQAGFDPIPEGSGIVVAQEPAPRTRVRARKCRIICKPLAD